MNIIVLVSVFEKYSKTMIMIAINTVQYYVDLIFRILLKIEVGKILFLNGK